MTLPTIESVYTPVTITVNLRDPLRKARLAFRHNHIKQLPVMHQGKLMGLVKEKDVWLLLGPDFDYPRESDLLVEDAYISNPLIVDIEEPLVNTLFLMAEQRSGCVLVTSKGKLAGIFTDTDACRCFGRYLQRAYLVSSI
jgi:predicted transcriptional regulator